MRSVARARQLVEATLLRQVPKAGVRSILVGLLGRGIGPSRSPFMHEAEGRRLGMDYVYARFDFDAADLADSDLAEVLVAAERAGFSGANITHPFKQVAIGLTTRLSVEAEAIGAVNTIVFRNGERIGHNTDSFGFAESFRATLTGAQLGSALLLGAGGGGAAVAHALLGLGISRLSIFDPEESRSRALAGNLRSHFNRPIAAVGTPDIEARGLDGIVNASPVGMKKYPGLPLPIEHLDARQWVADIVYFPPETELLRRARERGCRTLGGTGMAVLQAAKAFELFTGIAPDLSSMSRHFEAAA